MRIVVRGAGVIGSVYGGWLARSGHEVTLLARGQQVADLRVQGLVLGRQLRTAQENSLPVVDGPSLEDRYDLAVVADRGSPGPVSQMSSVDRGSSCRGSDESRPRPGWGSSGRLDGRERPGSIEYFGSRSVEAHGVVPPVHDRQAVRPVVAAPAEVDGDGAVVVWLCG